MHPPKAKSRSSTSAARVYAVIGFALLWTLFLGRRALRGTTLNVKADENLVDDIHHHHHARGATVQSQHSATDGGDETHLRPLPQGMEKPEVASHDFVQSLQHKKKVVTWHGQTYEEDGDWDFFGLKVPNSPAVTRAKEGQIRADYDLGKINGSEVPKGYEAPSVGEPCLRYPDVNDRLFVTASTRPRALFFPEIVTEAEVEEIIARASPKMARSQVAITTDGKKRGQSSTQEVRTSMSTWVNLDGPLANLDKRLSAIVGSTWHEPMNVLKYGKKQHYDSHHDYFDPSYYGNQANNRMATFYLYLGDTEAGGATTIPRANGGRPPANFGKASCEQGLQVFPRKGSGVLFYDMRPDRSLDPLSLHGACDVEAGMKWGGPVWFRANTPAGSGRSRE